MSTKRDLSMLTPASSIAEIQLKLGVSYTEARSIKEALIGQAPITKERSTEALIEEALDYELVAIKSSLSLDAIMFIKDALAGLPVNTDRSYEFDLLKSFGIVTLDGSSVKFLWDKERVNALVTGKPDPAVTEVARICMDLCFRTMHLTVTELVKGLTGVFTIPSDFITLVRLYRDFREENQRRGVPACKGSIAGGNIQMMMLKALCDRIPRFNNNDLLIRLIADYNVLKLMELSDSELFLRLRELISFVRENSEETIRKRLMDYTDKID